jgi:3',5'-cyclic AMP phosphodiesterase CpdA
LGNPEAVTLLVQITDTHILPPGQLLYGITDTAAHLGKVVSEINRMCPTPDLVLITGDLVEGSHDPAYEHFIELVRPLKAPVYVIPGNHDDPETMLEAFSETPYFPASHLTCQYSVEDFPVRILGLNSHKPETEFPGYGDLRLAWLHDQLGRSDKPTLIAIHHPPMKTGIEFIDMAGDDWFQGLKSVLEDNPQVKLVICGHCHTDLRGRIGNVPVFMAGSTAHQLIAARAMDIAPASVNESAPPVLHHFLDGDFLSGSYSWPADIEKSRIDVESGLEWKILKEKMRGSAR